MLKDLPHNTRIMLLLEPFSSVLACILTFYAALYMQANGLHARQIGLIATLAAVTGLLNQCVAAPVVNRIGRRKALLVMSLICWSIPLLCWMLAKGFMLFLVAALFFSVSRIAALAGYCVVTEEVDEEHKNRVFGLLFIIATIGGMGTLAAGPVIARFGLVGTMRVLYGLAFVSMTLMFLIRHRLLAETTASVELSRQHFGLSPVDSLCHHLQVVSENLANAEFRKLAMAWVLFSFAQAMGFVLTLYYNNVLKLTAGQLSLLPPLVASVGLVLYRLVVPRLNRFPDRFTVPFSMALMAGGQALLLLIPTGHMSWVLLAVGINSAGGYLSYVAINAALNNRMGALHKADAYSAVQFLVALAIIPAGWLAGSLFEADPRLALAGTIGVLVLAALAHRLMPGATAMVIQPQTEQEGRMVQLASVFIEDVPEWDTLPDRAAVTKNKEV
jgi:DHA1 family tetracycline resistance protein-like MFS transporter